MHTSRPATNRQDTVTEVRAAFERYEAALLANDARELASWFWDDARTVRYGIAESLYGHEAITAWRATADPVPASRRLVTTVITTFDDSCAVVDCEFTNGGAPGRGRQSQTWVRFDDGWKIVSAHVSMLEAVLD
ncbi:MAG: oxalurate catabolism protein HpxZ [Actinobacteria bacterium]|nr:oxalurate catabolism protein HpxZ [Actinomycetota bacterium]